MTKSTSREVVAVITAKSESKRLKGKNFLPLGGGQLVEASIKSATQAGLRTIVCTDSQPLTERARNLRCMTAMHPSGLSHKQVIEHAMAACGHEESACLLLQPTSPLRFGGIVSECISVFARHRGRKTVLTTCTVHDARITQSESGGKTVSNSGDRVSFWDGNVAVYPPGKVCDYTDCETVENIPINSVQIDEQEDYIKACVALEMAKNISPVLDAPTRAMLTGYLEQFGIRYGDMVYVACRPGVIPEDSHVVHVNHCKAYTGGRCDGLFLIANPAHKIQGVSKETRQCAEKARFVIVRDNGELAWLTKELPSIVGKVFPIRTLQDNSVDDHLTTGTIAVDAFSCIGLRPVMIGYPRDIASAVESTPPFHFPAQSREFALLWKAGVIGRA